MAKDKDRALNPAAAQRKAEKSRAIKKGKAAIASQRTERLAKTNPARLERQLADLHARQAEGTLPARERRQIDDLERDLERIRKARAAQPNAPRPAGAHKRTWEERGAGRRDRRDGPHRDDSSDTDESVRGIPMPRDTPPPVPTRRRPERAIRPGQATERDQNSTLHQPVLESKTVYEAKPQVKNLQKEAVAFLPSAVRTKINAVKGNAGKLLEAEELDRLEQQGYGGTGPKALEKDKTEEDETDLQESHESTDGRGHRPLRVQMEEVSDEDN